MYQTRILLAVLVLSLQVSAHSTNQKRRDEAKRLTLVLESVKDSNRVLKKSIADQKNRIDELTNQLTETKSKIETVSGSTRNAINEIGLESVRTTDSLSDIRNSIGNRSLLFSGLFLAFAAIGIFGFWLLSKALRRLQEVTLAERATNPTIDTFDAGHLERDRELLDVLKETFAFLKNQSQTLTQLDHKLPLKVGDEIHRMRKRISNMPQDVKGLGALRHSLNRLEEEFNEQGYVIEDLLGKEFNDGLRMEARFVEDSSVPKGMEIITDVLRPQISFRDKVIQFAKVEVGKSY